MILTLTGNLLAERTFDFADWQPGRTQRAAAETFQVGGKGINVSRMLQRLHSPTTAWCFTGGPAGEECAAWLADRALPHRRFVTTAPTRTGLVVRRRQKADETTFLGPDRVPDEAALRDCAAALEAENAPDRLLALCGSFPGWNSTEAGPLRNAVSGWIAAGRFVADTYGPPLSWLIERPVALIKINRQEFDPLFPLAERNVPVVERLGEALRRWPVQAWIVTDGPAPVCYAGVDTPPAAQAPPTIREASPTGSGDVLFAAVLHARSTLKLGLADAVHFALPYAAANAAHPSVADFDLNNLPRPRSVHP